MPGIRTPAANPVPVLGNGMASSQVARDTQGRPRGRHVRQKYDNMIAYRLPDSLERCNPTGPDSRK